MAPAFWNPVKLCGERRAGAWTMCPGFVFFAESLFDSADRCRVMKTTSGTAREAFLSFMTKASNIYFFCDNRVLTVILVFSCLFLGVIGNALSSSTNEYSTPRIIRYGFILHNRTHKTLTGIPFLSFLPVAINSNQRCDDFKASEPCKIETSVNGNRILNFHIDRIAPFESRKIDVRANLMMSETPVRLPATRLKKYLEPEKFIESGHPEIIRTARSLIRPNRSKTAEAFSGWVSNRIEYSGYLSRPRGALYAYRNKQGDCTEYASPLKVVFKYSFLKWIRFIK